MDNYLEILEDSLLQKKSLLDQIAAHSGKQEELLSKRNCLWKILTLMLIKKMY